MEEQWAEIDNFEDYQISSLGRVKSFKIDKDNGRILAYGSSGGYRTVVLRKDGKSYNKYIHRLVAQAFISNDNPDIYNQVNHKDENILNNCVYNLEWTTCKENNNYGTKIERAIFSRPDNIPHYRPVRCIETQKEYASISSAARDMQVRDTTIKRACDGIHKTCKGYHWEYI